jgi:hypothetical protein
VVSVILFGAENLVNTLLAVNFGWTFSLPVFPLFRVHLVVATWIEFMRDFYGLEMGMKRKNSLLNI